MSDHHTAGSLRHHADKNVTVPIKPGSQIGILGDSFVRKMSAGQQSVGGAVMAGVLAHHLLAVGAIGDHIVVHRL